MLLIGGCQCHHRLGDARLVELNVEEFGHDAPADGLLSIQIQQELQEPLETEQIPIDPHEIHLQKLGRKICKNKMKKASGIWMLRVSVCPGTEGRWCSRP